MSIILERKITRTGGSLEVSIPREIVAILKLKVGDTIQFTTSNGDIIIPEAHR
jgi:antitoxin component of MazEF toxin-antitoxin module